MDDGVDARGVAGVTIACWVGGYSGFFVPLKSCGADGRARSTAFDPDSDGVIDLVETITVSGTGEITAIVSLLNPDGSLKTCTTTTSDYNADGSV